MSRKATNEKEAEAALDLTELLSGNTVRSQLYRQEPKLPRISVGSAELVGTTAALFLQDLVKKSVDASGGDLCTASAVQKVVKETPSFSFLAPAVEEASDKERLIEFQPKPKRKRVAQTAKNAMKEITSVDSTDSVDPVKSEQIVLDEDDYD